MKMSSTTIKTDIGSKVLPGDKTGLPIEIWRLILSQLSAQDLCRSACVCKTWNDIVFSLDSTRWHELYLECKDWKHPYWPLNLHSEPVSWRQAYKEQYLASNFWAQTSREPDSATCLYVFKRTRTRKTITVGRGKEHESLKNALAVANDYDRISVYPGIYDEQFEMSSKIPFELVGCGELGSVILVVCIEQIALTGRVSNLVFRAPWFTNFILKIRSGYLQVDNCILEDGMVYVQSPGACHIKYCTFRHANIILQHVDTSFIENCEFSQTDSAAITAEGYPKEERNWTYRFMIERTLQYTSLNKKDNNQKRTGAAPKSSISFSTIGTNHKSYSKSEETDEILKMIEHGEKSSDKSLHSQDFNRDTLPGGNVHSQFGALCAQGVHNSSQYKVGAYLKDMDTQSHNGACGDDISVKENASFKLTYNRVHSGDANISNLNRSTNSGSERKFLSGMASNQNLTLSYNSSDKVSHAAKEDSPVPALNTSQTSVGLVAGDVSILSNSFHGSKFDNANSNSSTRNETQDNEPKAGTSSQDENVGDRGVDQEHLSQHVGDGELHLDLNLNGQISRSSSNASLRSGNESNLFDDEEDDLASGTPNSSDIDTSSSDEENLHNISESDFSSSEESVIMLTYPERHQPRSVSAAAEHADVASISSQNQSNHIDIIQDTSMTKMLKDVRGCLIRRCRITQSKGGLMVSLQGHATIMECEINGVGYGIRCIQNSQVVVLKNEIHHCRTSGIFMRLAATGLITGNDIHSNCEAGIDIRKNADPIVQCNRIHHGKRSGVVVLGSGRGQIRHNDIYQNKEAGVYILYRGSPVVSHNQIYSGRAAGVAVNEGGRGYIHDNVITGNQWGGVDIRHGGDPLISRNTICNGLSDGIVIGEEGRGSIEKNIITGNAGCGLWIMAARQPFIHGNEIHSNRDSGISLVNRMDMNHDNEIMMNIEQKGASNQEVSHLWNMDMTEDNNVPRRPPCAYVTIEYNKVYHNMGKGISLLFGDSVLVQCNYIHGNQSDGICIDQSPALVVKDNLITWNAGNGVNISSAGKVEIQGNGIYDNMEHGISGQNELTVMENDIFGNKKCGLHLHGCPVIRVKRNRIQGDSSHVIITKNVNGGDIEENKLFSGNAQKAVYSNNSNHSLAMNNTVFSLLSPDQGRESNDGPHTLPPLRTSRWMLTDPPTRPHIKDPPEMPLAPIYHMTSVTKVTVPSADTCQEGSKFCILI
ncbi:hypothetical protein ACJMK2_003892 [Sinanodonta woodiana]|uniref:F-box domain-containing protein n=1 Tax=Sinanodonta woodiana TaxID=1069815 RepID=A0ABD3Y2G7_SINWO